MKALIIEDSADVVEALSLCFKSRWPEAVIASAIDGARGINILRSGTFDVIILDLNLPESSGFDVLKKIRYFSHVPIIILTIREGEDDQEYGMEIGADDYIVKPFRPRDLIARVNAVVRRTHLFKPVEESYSITRGRLTLRLATDEVILGEEIIKLTPTEHKLLYFLMRSDGHTLSNEEILTGVWGTGHINNQRLRTNIRKLRDKLKDSPPRIILNEYGKGYRFNEIA